jgi:hypothetical protein
MTENGLPSWTAPSGRTYPPPPRSFTPPILPTAFTTYNEEDDEQLQAVEDQGAFQESRVSRGWAGDGPPSNPSQEPDGDPDEEPPWLHATPKPDINEDDPGLNDG